MMVANHPVPARAHPGVWEHFGSRHIPADQGLLAVQQDLVSTATGFPDLSEFNGPPDWDQLEAAYRAGTFSAVAIRAGFGTVRADALFASNQAEARRRRIPTIYYWFCYAAYNAPEAEATMCNEVVGPLGPAEAQCGDFEDDPDARPFPRGAAGVNWCSRFLTALQAPQNATWWYTYPYFLATVGLQPLIAGWPFWEADYSGTPDSAFGQIIARQFTNCGFTPGVSGCCDQSRVIQGPITRWLTAGGPVTEGSDSMDINNGIDRAVYDGVTRLLYAWSDGRQAVVDPTTGKATELQNQPNFLPDTVSSISAKIDALLHAEGVEQAAIDALAANAAAASSIGQLGTRLDAFGTKLDAVLAGLPPDMATALKTELDGVLATAAATAKHLGVGTP